MNYSDEEVKLAEDQNKGKSLRYWKCIIYPDSCGGGWNTDVDYEGLVDRLEEVGVQMFLSPIHNRDLTPDGEFKKSHIHVLIYVPGKKPYKRMLELMEPFGVKYLMQVEDHERDERYWFHLGCRNKVAKPEYPLEAGIALNNYNPTGLQSIKEGSDIRLFYRLIEDKGMIYFCDLGNEVLSNYPEKIHALNRFASFFDRYLQSRERIVRMVKNENKDKKESITSLMSSYKAYRVKFGSVVRDAG